MKFIQPERIGANDPALGECLNCAVPLSNIWFCYCKDCDNNPKLKNENLEYCKTKITEYLTKNKLTGNAEDILAENIHQLKYPLIQKSGPKKKIVLDNDSVKW